MADNLPPSSADVTEYGILNLPEPSGPHRRVMGMLFTFNTFGLDDGQDTPKIHDANRRDARGLMIRLGRP
jgi:hypothetical protein